MKTHPSTARPAWHWLLVLAMFWTSIASHAAGLIAGWGAGNAGQTQLPANVGNARAIAAGESHSLALKSDGTVVAWGQNDYHQTEVPAGLQDVVAIAAGTSHGLALAADGSVIGWGRNFGGQTNVPAGLSGVIAIAAGGSFSLALRADGLVTAWGNTASAPVPADLTNAIAIAAGGSHALALRADGTVAAWGDQLYGEVGGSGGLTNLPPGLSNVVAVAAGWTHSLALRSDGTVVAWGTNNHGQTSVPEGLTQVMAIAAGAYHCLARRADGSVVAWGRNSSGQTNVPAGLTGATAIAAGGSHSLALVFEGPVRILQRPASQTVPATSNATFSVLVSGAEPRAYQWFFNGAPLTDTARVSGSTNATLTIANARFADMGSYTVLVSNRFGAVLSDGATLTLQGPPEIISQSLDLNSAAGSDVTLSVAAGGTPPLIYIWRFNGSNRVSGTSATTILNTSLALPNVQATAAGTYSLWVSNALGTAQADLQLAVTESAPSFRSQPASLGTVAIGVRASFTASARGSAPLSYQWRLNGVDLPGATSETLSLPSLRVEQTGYYNVVVRNAFGEAVSAKAFVSVAQVLEWTPSGSATPVATNIFPGLTNLVGISAATYHVIGLKADGGVVVWKADTYYGTGAVLNIPAGLTNAIAVSAGESHCLALRSNGTVVAWGAAGITNVPASLSNVVAIAAGNEYSLALRSNGTVAVWGNNYSGTTNVPVGLSNVTAIAAGRIHCVALKGDGTLTTWGYQVPGYNSPPAANSNFIAIAAGQSRSLALKEDGTVVQWGGYTPPFPPGLSNVAAIAIGFDAGVLKSDGSVMTWNAYVSGSLPPLTNVIGLARGGSSATALIGTPAPSFALQPAPQIADFGTAVAFHARAVGLQPMSYQWQLNGRNLAGATDASLRLANLQSPDSGGYRCLASNALGAAASGTATLTIPFTRTLAQALNTTNLTWSTNYLDAVPWFAQIRETHDGDSAAQSGALPHSRQSSLQTTVTGPGTVAWWWKVSSEPGYDFLKFYVDNPVRASISGEVDWQRMTFAVPAGNHTLRWPYSKDASVSVGQDAGWLDEVSFTPDPPVIGQQPVSHTAWMGETVTFQAVASGAPPLSYQWLKAGTNLAGATNPSLTLTNLTRRDSATYNLSVANPGGATLSSNATLVVQVPQQLTVPVRLADGSLVISSGDADGGWLEPGDVAGFEFQASTDLRTWVTLPQAPTLTNGVLSVNDTSATNYPVRFYRTVEH